MKKPKCLTFCWRHSLHALFTPGCLTGPVSSASPSPLPAELSNPALSWVLFLPLPPPALVPVGLVIGVYVLPRVELTPLFLARPEGAPGGTFMSRKGVRVTPSVLRHRLGGIPSGGVAVGIEVVAAVPRYSPPTPLYTLSRLVLS